MWLQDFEEEQVLVARLLHNLVSDNPDTQFEVLQAARNRLARGGPERMKYTLPPIVFMSLSLVRTIKQVQGSGSPVGVTTEAVCPFPSFTTWCISCGRNARFKAPLLSLRAEPCL